MLNEFQFIHSPNDNISIIADELKELRRNLVHGYKYYSDFNNDINICRNINLLDDLIVCMSMKVIGFNNKETEEYMKRS